MEDSNNRASGIPRPSKLPISRPSGIPKPATSIPRPGSTASVRDSPSRASSGRNSAAGGQIVNPKLRSSASNSGLRSNISYGETRASRLRSSASREHLQRPSPAKPKALPTTPGQARRISSTSIRRTSAIADIFPTNRERDVPEEILADDHTETTRQDSAWISAPTLGEPRETSPDATQRTSRPSSSEESTQFDTFRSRGLKPRPSLSERTMETLAQIPSSPAVKKQASSFFEPPPSPMTGANQSRPGSSYSRPGSRQSTLSNEDAVPRTPANNFKSTLSTINSANRLTAEAPNNASTTTDQPTAVHDSAPTSLETRTPSPEKKAYGSLARRSGNVTAAARTTPRKPSVQGLFKKPSLPAMSEPVESATWDGAIPAPASPAPDLTEPPTSARKSSSALREQIARAKAAKRAAVKHQHEHSALGTSEVPVVPSENGFDFAVDHEDPFNINKGVDMGEKVLQQRIETARSSGRLNVAAMNLKEMPQQVLNIYNMESTGAGGANWAESVDLTRLVAADNELEDLGEEFFPDKDINDYGEDYEGPGNIFGGLETLDLHGNLLSSVPLGFRKLQCLTSLNLSSNRLTNECLATLAQMPALRDLKLSNNLLTGSFGSELTDLKNLEILDVHDNAITSLTSDIQQMSRLRILNLNENQLESVDFESLSTLPLTELLLKKNKLTGTLITGPVKSLSQLHTLDVSVNQLKYLVAEDSAIELPVLHALSLSINRLQGLPDMTSWESLLTLAVDENNISSIPNSFTSLAKLRSADFSSNDIKVVPPEISRMDSLSMIRLSGNPLRDKKFISITTEELKEVLAGRLEPPPPYQEQTDATTITELMSQVAEFNIKKSDQLQPLARVESHDDDGRSDIDEFATPPTSAHQSPARSRSHTVSSLRSRSATVSNETWSVKAGGVLDRSETGSSALLPAVCARVASEHKIRTVYLQKNAFSQIPGSLRSFADTLSVLAMSNNSLASDTYLSETLELPALKELNISNNRITSLQPLLQYLKSPHLEKLDVSINRIPSLPPALKESLPALSILLASSNQIASLEPDSVRGLKIVDASSNNIAHLNPRLGLLGGHAGLERLEVTGNRFKVPRWNILQMGSEATLKWLRGRLPTEEAKDWKRENGEASDDDDVD